MFLRVAVVVGWVAAVLSGDYKMEVVKVIDGCGVSVTDGIYLGERE